MRQGTNEWHKALKKAHGNMKVASVAYRSTRKHKKKNYRKSAAELKARQTLNQAIVSGVSGTSMLTILARAPTNVTGAVNAPIADVYSDFSDNDRVHVFVITEYLYSSHRPPPPPRDAAAARPPPHTSHYDWIKGDIKRNVNECLREKSIPVISTIDDDHGIRRWHLNLSKNRVFEALKAFVTADVLINHLTYTTRQRHPTQEDHLSSHSSSSQRSSSQAFFGTAKSNTSSHS